MPCNSSEYLSPGETALRDHHRRTELLVERLLAKDSSLGQAYEREMALEKRRYQIEATRFQYSQNPEWQEICRQQEALRASVRSMPGGS